MISFEFHLEKWHEKNQKPLWFLGFPNRYLFRFAMLARSTEKDITGFFEKSACDKAFSDFFYFFLLYVMVRDLSCPFSLRTEKDIIPIKSISFPQRSVHRVQNIPILLVEMVCAFLQKTNRLVPNIQAPH